MRDYQLILQQLEAEGRHRKLPDMSSDGIADFSSNDYLGLARRADLTVRFMEECRTEEMTSSASRLLAVCQEEYKELESFLSACYTKDVLLFNSGYHANTGALSALASRDTLIVADKLVHASIIDGIVLSKAPFKRFRHNDMEQLRKILIQSSGDYKRIIVVTESLFSMDGDEAPLEILVSLRREFDNVMLYVDEAHALGVRGETGLGIAQEKNLIPEIDLLVGTFGKACASMGAFVAANTIVKDYLINSARSLIFSTALPPINVRWSHYMLKTLTGMNNERNYLARLSERFRKGLQAITGVENRSTSQIVPWVVGDSLKTVELSKSLYSEGFIALPIRKPTVPEGTERIRFSLSAAMTEQTVDNLLDAIKRVI